MSRYSLLRVIGAFKLGYQYPCAMRIGIGIRGFLKLPTILSTNPMTIYRLSQRDINCF